MTEKYFVLFSTRKTFSNKTYFDVAAAYVRFCLQELKQENFEIAKKLFKGFLAEKWDKDENEFLNQRVLIFELFID